MGKPLNYELIVPAQHENLALIGEFVVAVARRAGLDEKGVFDVQLATDEACTNVIEYAYANQEGSIHIVCTPQPDGLVIQIHDVGEPFNPMEVPPPNLTGTLEERETGGLGLHFMRSVMDEIEFLFNEHGNHLTMTKRKTA